MVRPLRCARVYDMQVYPQKRPDETADGIPGPFRLYELQPQYHLR